MDANTIASSLPLPSLAQLAVALPAIAVGALVQGSVGFGLALVAAPILMLVEPRTVPGPMIAMALCLSLLMAVRDRRGLDVSRLGWAVAGRVPGISAGLVALAMLSAKGLRLLFAGLILLAVVMSAGGFRLPIRRLSLLGAGILSGFMGTTASIGGPPMALLYQNDPGEQLRANLASYFLVGTTLSLVGVVAIGRFGRLELMWALSLLPGMLFGFFISRRVARRLDGARARPAVLAVSAASACLVLIRELL